MVEEEKYWNFQPSVLLGSQIALEYTGVMAINDEEKYTFVALPSAAEDVEKMEDAIKQRLPYLDWVPQHNINGLRSSCNMRGERSKIDWDWSEKGTW